MSLGQGGQAAVQQQLFGMGQQNAWIRQIRCAYFLIQDVLTLHIQILIRSLPHLAIVACAFLWLLFGAAIFQWIDPKIGEKPFHRALLYAFELCTTIGWGDSHSSNAWSQLFCTVFTLLGVPFLFSAFANLGRLITEFYWFAITHFILWLMILPIQALIGFSSVPLFDGR